ncbi:NAD(P)-binding domain-containing protein [Macrococcus equi]|uniref:NAD(P)-binding domain-containing protein n=1 Tax=Macrococcus equi TaxID=3395462 RepID=UPI0039BDE7E3
MDFLKLKDEFKVQSYDSIVLATTSNHSSDFLRLPDKYINGQKCMSFSIANPEIATQVIQVFDGNAKYIYVDVERKQDIDFVSIAQQKIQTSRLREMKPNDLAMEAADILIYKTVKDKNSNVLIVGTGNIGIKLAIRLTERNYNVYLHGRNNEKVENFVMMINQMLPKYSKKIKAWHEEPIDVLCSMVSAIEVIDNSYIPSLKQGALAIDGGIGNFSKDFIKNAHLKDINVLRLDVRISNDLLNGIDQSYNSNFFTDIKGEKDFNGIHIVSGGIIGKEGDVIVDRIHIPKRVIGIANGIGGVKPIDSISETEKEQIAIINEEIRKEEK